MVRRLARSVVLLSSCSLFGCGKTTAVSSPSAGTSASSSPSSEAAVHNVVTDYVDRGVTTMDRARAAAEAANAHMQAVSQRAENPENQ